MADRELVEAVQGGRREAFGELVERHRAGVFRLCYRIAGNVPDAEDLAHEAFVEAYLKLHQLREPEKFAPWLRAVALNLCRMWYRRNRRCVEEPLTELPAETVPEESGPSRVLAGLARLSAPHRLVLVLHYWEELSYDEIARFLGVPIGTVMSRLHRARQDMKRQMATMTEEDEIPVIPDEEFRREVAAEIDVLLGMFRADPEAAERLSVILQRSPERFARLIGEAADEAARDDLALLLRRLGQPAIVTALECYLASDARLHAHADDVLRRFVARERPGQETVPSARIAGRGVYLLLDQVIRCSADEAVKAALLVDLIGACSGERAALLVVNVLLGFPDAALPVLLERFWQAEAWEALYRAPETLYALGRMGTRFAAALLEPLRQGDGRRQALALAGAEALARALRCDWLDPEDAEAVTLDARFRWKWAPPLPRDRDAAILQALAEGVAALLPDERAEIREMAVRTLGLLRSSAHTAALQACVADARPAIRVAALRALAEIGDTGCAELFLDVARGGAPAERQAAIGALGHLRLEAAQPLLAELVRDADPGVGRAAVFALGELGSDEARALLTGLVRGREKLLREAAARALQALQRRDGVPVARSQRSSGIAERIREGAQPALSISLEAAMRALPEIRAYDERTLSRFISQVCIDWAATRRYLVDGGFMTREGGVYQFTELGRAVWRVEQFIRARYMS